MDVPQIQEAEFIALTSVTEHAFKHILEVLLQNWFAEQIVVPKRHIFVLTTLPLVLLHYWFIEYIDEHKLVKLLHYWLAKQLIEPHKHADEFILLPSIEKQALGVVLIVGDTFVLHTHAFVLIALPSVIGHGLG